jgi:hypothetical protein
MVFRTKSKSEQVQEQAQAQAAQAAAQMTALKERVAPAAGAAAEAARERAHQAKDWAKPHVDHGIGLAAPRLERAVEGLAPRVDTARDRIVEDLLPKVAEAIAAVAAASTAARLAAEETVDRAPDAFAVLKGEALATPVKSRKPKGRMLITLGILAAVAAVAAALVKRSAPREDPWATPIEDPYTASTAGQTSTKEKVTSLADTAKEKAAGLAASAKEKVGGRGEEAPETTTINTVDEVTGQPTAATTETPFEAPATTEITGTETTDTGVTGTEGTGTEGTDDTTGKGGPAV